MLQQLLQQRQLLLDAVGRLGTLVQLLLLPQLVCRQRSLGCRGSRCVVLTLVVVVVVVLLRHWYRDVPALGLADCGGPAVPVVCLRRLLVQVQGLLLQVRCLKVLLVLLVVVVEKRLMCRLLRMRARPPWPRRKRSGCSRCVGVAWDLANRSPPCWHEYHRPRRPLNPRRRQRGS